MAAKNLVPEPSPLSELIDLEKEESREAQTVPVFEMNGDLYQLFKKPGGDEWDMSLIWKRHTVSSKAKDWGIVRARQSRPIPALYKRERTFESVPAFKQYEQGELKAVIDRVQRPTKSALLRIARRGGGAGEGKTGGHGDNKPSAEAASQQKVLVERLLRPTASQSRRVELTLKYRPPTAAVERGS